MSSISSALTSSINMRQNMFSRIDTNSDGLVSKDEFVSARPKNVSESQASDLFGKIDTAGTGSLTEAQLSEGMAKNRPKKSDDGSTGGNLASDVLAAIMQLVQQVESGQSGNASSGTPPSASDMFSKLDTDGDGSVTKAEFLAAKPAGVSDEQATNLFNSIDTDGKGSITLAQFSDSMKSPQDNASASDAGPPPPPPAGGGGTGTKTYDALDTNQDGTVSIDELLAAVTSSNTGTETASSSGDSSNSNSGDVLSQLLKAVQAYAAYNHVDFDQTAGLTQTAA